MRSCKEHDLRFPCVECERLRDFQLKTLYVAGSLVLMVLVIVFWTYPVITPVSLRAFTSVGAVLSVLLMWAHRRR